MTISLNQKNDLFIIREEDHDNDSEALSNSVRRFSFMNHHNQHDIKGNKQAKVYETENQKD